MNAPAAPTVFTNPRRVIFFCTIKGNTATNDGVATIQALSADIPLFSTPILATLAVADEPKAAEDKLLGVRI